MAQPIGIPVLDDSPYLFPVYDPTDEEVQKYPFLNGGAAMAKKGRHPILLHCAKRFNLMVIARSALQDRAKKMKALQERFDVNEGFYGTVKFDRATHASCIMQLIELRAGVEGMKNLYKDCMQFFEHISEEGNAFGFTLQEVGLGRKYFQAEETPEAPVEVETAN